MANENYGEDVKKVSMRIFAGNDPSLLQEVTPHEIILGESLTTPGLQTTVRVQSYFHNIPIKNLDNFKGTNITIELNRPVLAKYGLPSSMRVSQTIYRLENRTKLNNVVEEYTIRACDQTLLNDAETLVSKSWKCTTPSSIVSEMLRSCAGARTIDVEGSAPARDYVANNIHPFRVIDQQAEAALAGGNDPSFIHYMTYQNLGTHHFRSLRSLTKQSHVMEYFFDETASLSGYGNPRAIMTHSFPCDFDLLSDILNGIGPDGANMSSLISFNPFARITSLLGSQVQGCGNGSAVLKAAMSNFASEQEQNACPDYSQFFALKRQARMGLLEEDKIALKITVPWNPILNAGKIIKVTLNNKNDAKKKNYGSGNYLIRSLTHNIKYGGFATTTMDCVSQTVGSGGIV
jgi:hypothetical protein